MRLLVCKTCRSARQLVFVFLIIKVCQYKENGKVTHVNILVDIFMYVYIFEACRVPGSLSIH